MDAYTSFAEVYDTFMDNVDYDEWGGYLIRLLREHGLAEGCVVELGCGTGSVTERLAAAGYEVTALDLSADMLTIAERKREALPEDVQERILYVQQDMRELALPGTADAFTAIGDSLNYVTDAGDLFTVFMLVHEYLEPGGLFVFDLNTRWKYDNLLAENTFAETREDCAFIWENYYDPEERINEYDLNLFIENGDHYERFEEFHYQKAYDLEEICGMLERAGFEILRTYDSFTEDAPREDSERVHVAARKRGEEDE